MRPTAVIAVLIAAAALAPAAAQAKDKRFRATVTATQSIDWNQPRVYGTKTCYGTSWIEGEGKETFQFQSRPTNVVVYKSGKFVYFEYQTKKRGSYSEGIPGHGEWNRIGDYRNGQDPGACGGGSPMVDQGPYDCGTRSGQYETAFSDQGGGDLRIDLNDAFLQANDGYATCPIIEPPNWVGGSLREITAPFSARALMRAKKPLKIHNKWSGRDETLPSSGLATAETSYTLNLKPLN